MKRLIENTVFSGFVIAWRLATCPTRISPSLVKPTTEGVSRLPSWFAITVGLPPSTTATTRSEEHTSELQSRSDLVCRLLLEKKKHLLSNGAVTPTHRALRAAERSSTRGC